MKSKASPAKQEEARDAKVDPILLQQLNTGAASAAPLEAVIMLRPDDPSELAAPPNRAVEMTHQVLERVEKQTGTGADRVNIFRNFGSFAISAHPDFLRELLRQPEVASAMANKRSTQAYIQPIDVEPVKPTSDRGWSSSGAGKKSTGRAKANTSAKTKTRKTAKAVKSVGASKSHK
jgi:hypothetical protein